MPDDEIPTADDEQGTIEPRADEPEPDHEPTGPEPAGSELGSTPESRKLVVVGIGASAGGLDALGELLQHVPVDEMAFIVVQHLAPHHESLLPHLLARNTRLEVVTAADGTVLEANRIYVIPPNTDLAVMQGAIRLLAPPGTRGPRLPIDFLFRSLADDQGPRAIGIVLSGTGTDGTFGLKAIKAAGGVTFVQEPASAKYDGMPRSALASGAADFCLTLRGIGEELARIASRPVRRPPPRTADAAVRVESQLAKIFVMIRSEFGTDLSHYKQATIERRIERRMGLHRMGQLEDYVRLVQQHREELHGLYKDLLINVTRFFRDPDAFEAIKSHVLSKILERKDVHTPVRVWVPGCSTGEEAYSLAICLLELCEDHRKDVRLQVFGTDLDDECVQYARRGVYPANIALDVSTQRIHRFFLKKGDEYHVSRRVRDVLVFSRQNVLRDAPFSRLDLVSCRNLLIYLQPASQKRVLRVLHYALEPSGYLVLGTSETVSDAPELFAVVDRKYKIYQKKHAAAQAGLDMAFGVPRTPDVSQPAVPHRPTLNLQHLADRKVLELYAPPGVVINEDLEILQFRGHTGSFLDPTQGAASLNVLKVVRFELHIALKRAIQQAISSQLRITTDVTFVIAGKPTSVALDVLPLHDLDSKARCLLVLFQPVAPPSELSVMGGEPGEPVRALGLRVQELEGELATTKDYLQTTIEDKESTLEELQSANEELQSANEELQSTNEELETSKEELQSTNEELTTVNDELQNRMIELSQTNDDLHNVLSGVDNAVVIVGMDLRIRRYTAAAEKLFRLVPGDVGRSIGFLDSFLATGALEPKLASVIQSLASVDEEVLASNHRWYVLKICPYQTLDHTIRGALVTLIDIDVRKRAAELTLDVGAYASRFLAAIGHPLVIVDRKHRVVWCNDPFLTAFQLTQEETVGNQLSRLGARRFDDPKLDECMERGFASSTVFRGVAVRIQAPELGPHAVQVSGGLIPASGETPLMLLSFELPAGSSPGGPR